MNVKYAARGGLNGAYAVCLWRKPLQCNGGQVVVAIIYRIKGEVGDIEGSNKVKITPAFHTDCLCLQMFHSGLDHFLPIL